MVYIEKFPRQLEFPLQHAEEEDKEEEEKETESSFTSSLQRSRRPSSVSAG